MEASSTVTTPTVSSIPSCTSPLYLDGVFLAATPANVNDGAKGSDVLAVTLPSSFDLDEFAIEEEGRPVWEWCVPAETLNTIATVRLLTEAEEFLPDLPLPGSWGQPSPGM